MRRTVAQWALFVLALTACSGPRPRPPQQAGREARFNIIQVNDTYKIEGLENGTRGGMARLRTLRRRLEGECRPVLVLHAGDLLYPSVMSKYLRAQPVVRILNLLDGDPAGFDASLIATFGNHEFDDRDPGVLLGRIAQSDFAWVSSNVLFRSATTDPGRPLGERLQNVQAVAVRELDGIKVGIFGLSTDVAERDYIRYDYAEAARREAVEKALSRLKEAGARVIVALTHQDLTEDERLAAEFPQIDLIAGGHEHFHIARRVGRTWITKADADAQSAVVYDVRVTPEGVTAEPRKVVLDAAVEPDPQVQAEVARYQAQLLAELGKSRKGLDGRAVVARTRHLLEGVETAVRSRETALGNFLADVIRQRMGTDIGLLNGGGIRSNDNIVPGPVTRLDLEGLFYFDDDLVAFELSGAELLEVLHNAVSKSHLGDGRFLQVAGLRFRYHRSGGERRPGYRIDPGEVQVLRWGAGGYEPLRPERRYIVASTDFLWESGYQDGYTAFAAARGGTSPPRLPRPKVEFRRALEEAIAALPQQTITSAIEGRIVAVTD